MHGCERQAHRCLKEGLGSTKDSFHPEDSIRLEPASPLMSGNGRAGLSCDPGPAAAPHLAFVVSIAHHHTFEGALPSSTSEARYDRPTKTCCVYTPLEDVETLLASSA